MTNQEKLKYIAGFVHKELLKPLGYKRRRNTFNRKTEEGIIQVINFQASTYNIESPETTKIKEAILGPEPAYGKFTINFGVWIPELAVAKGTEVYGNNSGSVAEYKCEIRGRIGNFLGKDIWFSLDNDLDNTGTEVLRLIKNYGMPFFKKFETRNKIILILENHKEDKTYWIETPLVNASIMHLHLGNMIKAQELLQKHYDRSVDHQGHRDYLEKLAKKLGLKLLKTQSDKLRSS